MIDLKMITKIPHKRRYQKFENAELFSDWLRDLIKLAVIPLEKGSLILLEEE